MAGWKEILLDVLKLTDEVRDAEKTHCPKLTCLVARLRRCGKGYIAGLCAPCRALKTNHDPARFWDNVFLPRP